MSGKRSCLRTARSLHIVGRPPRRCAVTSDMRRLRTVRPTTAAGLSPKARRPVRRDPYTGDRRFRPVALAPAWPPCGRRPDRVRRLAAGPGQGHTIGPDTPSGRPGGAVFGASNLPRSQRLSVIFHPLRVKRIVPDTAEAVIVSFEVPPELRPVFGYTQGQYLTLRHEIDGQ